MSIDGDEYGKQIRFIKGTYKGKTGWINQKLAKEKRKNKKKLVDVIVLFEDSNAKRARVKKTSFRDPHEEALTYEEQALQDHPDVELAIIDMAAMIATLSVIDMEEMHRLIKEEIENATLEQILQGKDARYRKVNFDEKKAKLAREKAVREKKREARQQS